MAWPRWPLSHALIGFKGGPLGKFFNLFWGWADYKPQDWSNAPYKRGYR
jgi:hypothetical protein